MAKFDLLIKACEAIDGDNIFKPSNGSFYVGCREGRIAYLGDERPSGRADESLEIEYRELLLPGFIDPHVHPREPGHPEKETYETLGQAAINGGVTTAFGMPNTTPPIIVSYPELIALFLSL